MPMLSESQLHWRCRRGVRELDVLFNRFVTDHYPSLEDEQKQTFQELLEVQDPTIMDWLFEKESPEDIKMQGLVSLLKKVSGF